MKPAHCLLCLLLASNGFADEPGRQELARYGEIELSTVKVPTANGHVGVSVVFTLANQSVAMISRSELTAAAAEQFLHGVAVQQCRSSVPGRFILRVSSADADSGYFAVDQTKKVWGHYPSSGASCPAPDAAPPAWNPLKTGSKKP
jgi:hypothetical protein